MKLKSIFATALAATVLLASCSKDNDGGGVPTDKAEGDFVISFLQPNGTNTRATSESDRAKDATTTLHDASIFFLDGAGKVLREAYTYTLNYAIDPVALTSPSGVRFPNIQGGVETVLVFANVKLEGAGDYLHRNISEVYASNNNIPLSDQWDDDRFIDQVIMSGDVTYDASDINPATSNFYQDATSKDWKIKVTITPMASRVELAKLTALEQTNGVNDKGIYNDYVVSGFYINSTYLATTLRNAPVGSIFDNLRAYKQYARFVDATTTPDAKYLANYYGYLFDDGGVKYDGTSAKEVEVSTTGMSKSTPTAGKVWGYNVFPHGSAGNHFIVHLTNVSYNNGGVKTLRPNPETGVPGEGYLTVTHYIEGGNTVQLKGGHVYTMEDLAFNLDHITDLPEPEDGMTCEVVVSIAQWVGHDVEGGLATE